MSRFASQDSILQAITTDLIETLLDGLLASITLAIMFLFAPTLAGVVVGGALLYALLRWVSYAPLRHASAEAIVWGAGATATCSRRFAASARSSSSMGRTGGALTG